LPATEPSGRHWPRLIVLGLAIVVVVNFLFAYIAISGADSVVSSYRTEAR
jgi:hypothetical protein